MIERFGQALAAWLLPVNAWTAVLLAGALLLDRALARRARASVRMALYAPIALRVLLPLSWSLAVTRVPRVAMLLPLDPLYASRVQATSSSWSPYAWLAVVYLAMAAVLAARAVVRRWQLARALASARPATSVEGACPVLFHRDLGPMVVGLLAPRIVLPEAMSGDENRRALEHVLRHEHAHLRRKDLLLSAAIECLLVAAWPVLPLWIAAARVRHLVELACDEAALAQADATERRTYGHVLLDFAERGSPAFAGGGSLHFGSRLRARIEAIALHRPWPRAVQVTLVTAAALGFVACSSTAPGGNARTTTESESVDRYGYQFDDDPVAKTPPKANAPAGTSNAGGRLAPEVIQDVVRQSFGAFRSCYETGLKKNAKLAGKATVSFVINPDGSVGGTKDDGSTLPDADVVGCVVKGFAALSFPPPQGGYVTVVYPIEFAPGD